jgi:hypothetical protein
VANPLLKPGPLGLTCFVGGVAFLFLPAKIKLKECEARSRDRRLQ